MIQLDNLSIQGMANGTISFFGNVMRNLQVTYGTNAQGWVNVINDLDDIIYADNLRSVGLDTTETLLYQAYSIVNNRKQFLDRSNVDYIDVLPDVNVSTGVISPHYNVLIDSKIFSGNVAANAISLQNFISQTLDNNNTYIAANVVSSKQYSVDNGFVTDYASIDSTSFDTASITPQLQAASEIRLATLKTALANNKFID